MSRQPSYLVKRSNTAGDWSAANVLADFFYPWEDGEAPRTEFRAVWDSRNLCCRFDVDDDDVKIYRDSNVKMEVVNSDRVEMFFRSDARMSPYYCLEIDPLGRVLDYRARFHREFEYDWAWLKGLGVQASRQAAGYRVDIEISLNSLREFGLLQNQSLQVGLYRANCIALEGKEAAFKWISWVSPGSPVVDFHVPATFGLFEMEGS